MIYNRYSNYIDRVVLKEKPEQWTFKSNPEFTYMLEHVSVHQGLEYYKLLTNKSIFKYNIKYFSEISEQNDKYGNPAKYAFEGFTNCSPTNLRYIFHCILLFEYVVEKGLNDICFTEIGGGYGGECFFVHKIAMLFNVRIKEYIIFDLQNPSILQKKYLELHKIPNIRTTTLEKFKDNIEGNRFLMSNYAFSEIPKDLQEEYITRIIEPYVTHGFICWNSIEFYEFKSRSKYKIEEEYPLTGTYNKYIWFSPISNEI